MNNEVIVREKYKLNEKFLYHWGKVGICKLGLCKSPLTLNLLYSTTTVSAYIQNFGDTAIFNFTAIE